MSVSILFQNCSTDPRYLHKDFLNIGEAITLNPIEPVDDLTVRAVVNFDSSQMSATHFQYNGKKYKVIFVERLPASAMSVTGTVDVLATYETQIKNADCICSRNENVYNSQFVDPKYMLIQNREYETRSLGSLCNWNDFKIVMCYSGGLPKESGGTSSTYGGHSFGGGGGNW